NHMDTEVGEGGHRGFCFQAGQCRLMFTVEEEHPALGSWARPFTSTTLEVDSAGFDLLREEAGGRDGLHGARKARGRAGRCITWAGEVYGGVFELLGEEFCGLGGVQGDKTGR